MLKQQSGVSLLEILIALLLLAIAVLGFSAMQMRAVKATDETLYRGDALVAIRNISEDLRLYPTKTERAEYLRVINSITRQPNPNCNNSVCTVNQQIAHNAYQSVKLALDNGISFRALDCPGIHANASLKKMCIIAAWGDTRPTTSGDNACIDSAGVYNKGTTCFVVETY